MIVGKTLAGKYLIKEQVRQQSLYDVYIAQLVNTEKRYLVKWVRKELVEPGRTFGRIKPNLMVVASMRHQGISSLRDFGEDESIFLVEDFYDGALLRDVVDRSAGKSGINPLQAVNLGIKITDALHAAHSRGIIHGQITPESIIVSSDLNPKLSDFYLLYYLTAELKTSVEFQGRDIRYCAPEIISGSKPTFESDIYSVGIMLYELLTGKPPFDRDNMLSIALDKIQADVASLRDFNPNVPRLLESVVLKCIKRNPESRYKNAGELLSELHLCRSSILRAVVENRQPVPTPAPLMDQLAVQPDEQPAQLPAEQPAEQIVEQPSEQPAEQPAEPPAEPSNKEQPAVSEAAAIAEPKLEQPVVQVAERPAEPPVVQTPNPPAEQALVTAGSPAPPPMNVPESTKPQQPSPPAEKTATLGSYVGKKEESQVVLPNAPKQAPAKQPPQAQEQEADPPQYQEGPILKKRELPRGLKPFLIALGVFIALLIGFLMMMNYFVGGVEIGTVVVPSVEGKSVIEAKALLGSKNLVPVVIDRQNSDEIPEGYILKQLPEAGTKVKSGREIRLILSKGQEKVTVPKLTGMTLEDAKLLLEKSQLKLGEVRKELSDQYEEGLIIDQSPAAGEERFFGRPVNVVISSGKETRIITMPRITDLEEDQARDILEMNEIKNVQVQPIETGASGENTVVGQSVLEGTRVAPGQLVTMYVAVTPSDDSDAEVKGVVSLNISENEGDQEVVVMVFDNNGAREAYRSIHGQGEKLKIPVAGTGKVNVKVYLNGFILREQNL